MDREIIRCHHCGHITNETICSNCNTKLTKPRDVPRMNLAERNAQFDEETKHYLQGYPVS